MDEDITYAHGEDAVKAGQNEVQRELPIRLLAGLNITYSFERSFKFSPYTILSNRYVMGFKKERLGNLADERILAICEKLGMPADLIKAFKENLPDSNYAAFGYGENETTRYYKAYLDFFEKIIKSGNVRPGSTRPETLYLGFKWDPRDNRKGLVTKYTTFPLLPYQEMMARLSHMLGPDQHKNLFEIAQGIIGIASRRIPAYGVFYVEVTEKDNRRMSFDINIYRAKYPIREMYPLFWKMYRHYDISADRFHNLYQRIKDERFGHLAGGIDGMGNDFLTVYYGVDYLSGRMPQEPFLEL